MESIEVSVIIPVYNGRDYIAKCIESIRRQSFKKIEIIVINDGSDDDTDTICSEIQKQDSRILLLKQEHLGIAVARREGVFCANGKYVVFIDADDYVKEDYIEVLYNRIVKSGAEMVCCNHYIVNNSSIQEVDNIKQDTLKNSIHEFLIDYFDRKDYAYVVWGKMFRTQILKKAVFNNMNYFEDTYMILSLFPLVSCIELCTYSGYYYVKRSNSVTANVDWVKKTRNMLVIADYVYILSSQYADELRSKAIKQLLDYLFAAIVKHDAVADKEQMQEFWAEFDKYYDIIRKEKKFGGIKRWVINDFALKNNYLKRLILLYDKTCRNGILASAWRVN